MVPACHFHILYIIWQQMCRQKLLLAQRMEQCSIRRFLISICFIVKMIVSTTKLDLEAFEMTNQIYNCKISNPGKLDCVFKGN